MGVWAYGRMGVWAESETRRAPRPHGTYGTHETYVTDP
jgi:hypothetical protein